jgi:hypothetical protein
VVADSAAAADVLAKTLALQPERLDTLRVPARVCSAGGRRSNHPWLARSSTAANESD